MMSPRNGEGPTVRPVGPLDISQSEPPDFPATRLAAQAPAEGYRKRLTTVQAKLALAGFQLYELSDETLLLTRWGMTRTFPGLNAAEAFARHACGGVHA